MSAAPTTTAIGYDVATSLWQGKRPYQEDTLLADFHGGMDRGFAVLADGMGGHAAGDLASRLVVIDAVSHLKFLMHDGAALEKNLQAELTSAIETANDVLRDRGAEDNRLKGMGATFLATVMFEDRLYWASVGDSPLYLWREGELRQLNADHSMAPVIDQMAKSGEITAEEAANHPDRNALTSVLMGSKVKSTDVPKMSTVLDPGDVLIQASDGLQYLDERAIVALLKAAPAGASSREIADLLMSALYDLNDPAQDNTAILVLQLTQSAGPGGGGKTVAKGASVERAVGATAAISAAMSASSSTSTSTASSAPDKGASASKQAPTAPPVDPPPGGRRRLALPAALLGGAALALGAYFVLPSEQTGPTSTPQPIADVQQPAGADNPVADPEPALALAEPPVAAAPVVEPASDEEILIEDGPAVAALPETEPADPPVEETVDAEGAGIADPAVEAPVETAAAEVTDADGALTETDPAPEAEAAEAATPPAAPQRSGDVASPETTRAPQPDNDTDTDAAGSDDALAMPDEPEVSAETPLPDEEVAAAPIIAPDVAEIPQAPQIAPESNGFQGLEVPNGNEAVGQGEIQQGVIQQGAGNTAAAVGIFNGGTQQGNGTNSGVIGQAIPIPAPAPVPTPAPAPVPVPTPTPAAPAPAPAIIALPQTGGTPLPGQIVPLPGIGRLNETMNAPAASSDVAPAPAPSPVVPQTLPAPTSPLLLLPAEEDEVRGPASSGLSEGQRATSSAPDATVPYGQPRSFPLAAYGARRVCDQRRCYTIITRPGGNPAGQHTGPLGQGTGGQFGVFPNQRHDARGNGK